MNCPNSAVVDHDVDRWGVYAHISKSAQLTHTNRTNGLIVIRVCSAILELPRTLSQRRGSLDNLPLPGDHTGKVTPVPIPNTAVKLARADDSLTAKVGRRLDFFSETARVYNTRAVSFSPTFRYGCALWLGLWPCATAWPAAVALRFAPLTFESLRLCAAARPLALRYGLAYGRRASVPFAHVRG